MRGRIWIYSLRKIKSGEELTYNYGVESYDMGKAYGHIALEVNDAAQACEAVRKAGGKVVREANVKM